ncbi:MAG: hypothetical protein HGA16_01150 [Candidatus Moranbacteria bacterium]|nr:hypothetical protein [Candidatus Moranbacteria bacterium]
MEEGKILVSCYGFWLGVEDGKAGNGSPRSVYCIIGEKALGLTFSKGEVLDLLDPETVRSMYGPCSLEQMIGYIKEAMSARGGDLGIDFATSVFAKIVARPDRYVSGEEIPYKWKDYFVVPPKKGRGAGRREDEVRGYLLAVKVEEYDISHLSVAKSRQYRKQVQGAQRLLREKIREYRSTSDLAKREALKADIMKNLTSLEQGLSLLGIPISDTEKGTSRSDAAGGEKVVLVGDVRTQGRRAGRGPSKDSKKKRKIGVVAFKDDESRRAPGRPMQRLTRDQELEKKLLESRMRKLELRIGRNEAILREKRSATGERRRTLSDLGTARKELKETKECLTTLLYGAPIPETPEVAQVASFSENDGVGSVVAAAGVVEVSSDLPVEGADNGGVVIPFPHAMPPSDGASVVEESVAPEDFPLSVIGSESFRAFCAEMEAMREELESLLATLQAQFRASGIYESETFERFKELNGRKGDALQNLQVLTDKMAAMFPPCRVGRMSLQ